MEKVVTEHQIPTLNDIQKAYKIISQYAHRTPIMTCQSINEIVGAKLYFKCENFQKVGAFKFRGAINKIFSLTDEECESGVVTHSSGNHAQAVALSAKIRGVRAYIVMPSNAPKVKKAAVTEYGAEIIFCEPTQKAREKTSQKIVEKTGATFVHPYNDPKIIAGHGTAALEFLKDVQNFDAIIAPISGGGFMSGTSIAVSELSPKTKIIGVEPKLADDAYRSLKENRIVPSGYPDTIADGLRMSLGPLTFRILKKHVHQIVTVTEEQIVQAMRLIWERMKIVVEPSSATVLSVLLTDQINLKEKKVGLMLTGGNVDLENLPF